jgi:calcium-dependent protein kinase
MTKPLAFPYNGKIGEHTRDFIKKCLTVDEKNRIGWKELFEHPLVEERSTGRQVEPPKVEKSAVEIMKRIQESAARKNVDVRAILQQKNIDKMDESNNGG